MGDEKSPEVDVIPDDVVGPERTLRQMFNLFFTPEIERRKAAGLLAEPFSLSKAQVMFLEGRPNEVRLNDEVKISLIVKLPRAVQKGDAIDGAEIEHIEGFELDSADRDAGHFTTVLMNGNWLLLFAFRRNKGKASILVKRAEEFCATAEHALSQNYFGPYVDNLFSACELLAKARLITAAAESSGIKGHGAIHSGINRWGKLGNVDGKFVATFNKLSNARASARYRGDDMSTAFDAEILQIVRNEISDLKKRLLRFSDSP
jgi:hypothetical protein